MTFSESECATLTIKTVPAILACGSLTVLVAALICGFDFVGSHSAAVQQFRQIVLLVSSGVAVLISIMWLVCFVILRKLWNEGLGNDLPDEYKRLGQTTLAFSLLSIPLWAAVGFLAFRSNTAASQAKSNFS
ncbi:uncharacterized protein LOC134184459 [Corticium candelabrum]|uniref:uncharacterized protein LOC134184459 n=1 Tax=Corticium candelabrum TaxID=121492 RepID=UPI002E34B2FC|nr:uncharacterized protein LOC134184459 [Corticium candelabrum]